MIHDSHKTIVVIGGSSGIGRALIEKLIKNRFNIATTFYSSDKLLNKIFENYPKEKYLITELDIRNYEALEDYVDLVNNKFNVIHGLVNLASYSNNSLWKFKLINLSLSEWNQIISVDLTGSFLLCKVFYNSLKQSEGNIVLFSSACSFRGDSDTAVYNVAKYAIEGLVKTLAQELSPNININAISPGAINTAWINDWNIDQQDIINMEAMKKGKQRLGEPSEIASFIIYLLSSESDYINGQNISMDGGINL